MDRLVENIRTVLYIVVLILANMAATTLFFRFDLTRNSVHTISQASRDAVNTLREPLTVRAFFSPDMPAPYNAVEQQVRDLLQEYAAAANSNFNYSVYEMEAPEERPEVATYEDLARGYRIYPVQIQDIDRDEVKLVNAYMGMAFVHGDLIETIPAVTSTDGLEFQMTEAIRGLSDRVSALLAMDKDIAVTLYFSSSLSEVGGDLRDLPGRIETIVSDLDDRYYDRLQYTIKDPDTDEGLGPEAERYRMPSYRLRDPGSGDTKTAFAGLAISQDDRVYGTQILVWDLGGVRSLDDGTIQGAIEESVNALLGIHDDLSYVVDFGTPPYRGNPRPTDQVRPDLATFYQLTSQRYGLRGLSIGSDPIPEVVGTMMIVSPTEQLTDYALFQIDQFLMRGNSLMLFLDPFSVTIPGRSQGALYGEAYYEAMRTGLSPLLEHYGLRLDESLVLDEESYVQRTQTATGGIAEVPVYFAPVIRRRSLENRPSFVENLDGIVVPNVAPLESTLAEDSPITIRPVLSSTRDGWRVVDPQVLNYVENIQPPPQDEQSPQIIAYLLEGRFTSYFADKTLPTIPESPGQSGESQSGVALQTTFVPESRGGRIFVIGTSSVLGSNVLDASGRGPNTQFLLNTIDTMNGREDLAEMRVKGEMVSRLEETKAGQRSLIKTFNIAGLPLLVVLVGILIWLGRSARARRIRDAFMQDGDQKP